MASAASAVTSTGARAAAAADSAPLETLAAAGSRLRRRRTRGYPSTPSPGAVAPTARSLPDRAISYGGIGHGTSAARPSWRTGALTDTGGA
jgi:hypothetical protein